MFEPLTTFCELTRNKIDCGGMLFKISWRSLIKMFLTKNPKILNSEYLGKLWFFKDLFYTCVSECVYLPHMHLVLGEARRGQQGPLEQELLAIGSRLLLVTEPRSSASVTVSASNRWAISPAPQIMMIFECKYGKHIQMCPHKACVVCII